MYIYKFTHIDSGRSYIGQTIQDPNHRRLEHISGSRYSEKTYHFHNAIKKYGIDSFIFEVIDKNAVSLEELNILEEKYVIEYDSINNGFNIRTPGDNKTHNLESIKRMSTAQKNAHARRKKLGTDTWIRKDGGAMLGKTHPNKGGTSSNKGKKQGMTWEEIYGIEGAANRRQAHAIKALSRKSGG
jgi:hypothetical protein